MRNAEKKLAKKGLCVGMAAMGGQCREDVGQNGTWFQKVR